jgi:hypothetical protein
MMKIYLAIVPVVCWMNAGSAVILTGIMDGTLTGGMPKAIELFVTGTEDLGNYELWRSQNGDPWGAGLGSRAVLYGIYSNTFVYLVHDDQVAAFHSVFGSTGFYGNVIPHAIVSGNGNEGYQIRTVAGSVVVDQLWLEDPTYTYRDSFWYRNHGTGPDGTWLVAHWWSPGNDALDGLDEAGLRAAVPFGSYAQVWRGTSTDWNEMTNWHPENVPGANCNVIIYDTAASFPVITNGPASPAECLNLTVVDSATVTIAAGKAMIVHGNLVVDGPGP